MKTKFYIAVALVAGVLAACDGQAKKAENHEGHDHSSHDGHSHEATVQNTSPTGPSFNSDALNNVYGHYIHLKNNLVASNEAESKTAAAALKTAIADLKDAEVLKAAEQTAAATNLEGIRASFNDLSKQIERVIKSTGVKSGEVYVEFCPMANNDKGGFWLSNSSEIQNPYYGDQMMKCGSVEETLK
ncbi:DUF3347 domain-containing protein [Solitalea canadensis]|uniref:DUF3347 domain-containing protein n=1 Tax=Solitalea canadensis (strain ATCC 29591 / DSM 3403 / JCM 21819 / LMG 8368 / NBRC 15130 / NCIMB 12057 / USAM 9D) TaxID=929556 RepID=H8KUU0_SOLCM|nr:DUF3347 domain-containing protein [Solitalea canadensis]AFD07574.1 Protein of unknown function (DUF3347) [Solitalea canadensis DSM 3403]